jgi:hypothetical protein
MFLTYAQNFILENPSEFIWNLKSSYENKNLI